ncbi:3'(2'),5'-bisphosphate nucleotidase CysQ [Methylobacterium organophilum]|uniref:3'(2'),5'-bisphosphate nucleotidase CysQ family protein n=1 Tax=Methylobacterium organophilum TaxID=410 RepID=UPI001F12C21B|nr:3'(2'),5'-bisphosphate nucleotidase CysQ [Methylobacterium organophilum]UMY19957.1 3'(2'),5'-bisphosphate nucleotidase CysQ [Methylobacterium organophilum]
MSPPAPPAVSAQPSPVSLGYETCDAIAERLAAIACEAGEILRSYHGGDCPHQLKPDGSPASLADARSEACILERLRNAWPGIPVVAEETCCDAACAPLFFLVDPLDGTRDFLAGSQQYCVNICLVRDKRPIASAVAAPGLFRVWCAGDTAREAPIREGRPAEWHAVSVRAAPGGGLVALVSRRHGDSDTDACLERLPIAERRVASSALKFCLIAAGEADIYVRCAPTMEWDTAAGDHVLTVAGGRVLGPEGAEVTYGHRARFYRNGPFAALGDTAYALRLGLPRESAVSYFDRRRAGEVEPHGPVAEQVPSVTSA